MPRGFIAGAYYWSYNGLFLGTTENGFRLSMTSFGDPIKGDNLGDSIQDFVYRGGDVSVEGTLQEFEAARLGGNAAIPPKVNARNQQIFWPYAIMGATGAIGTLSSLYSAPLVGTPVPGTSADLLATVKNLTMNFAILPPNYDVGMLFAARLRNLPIRLQALPFHPADPSSVSGTPLPGNNRDTAGAYWFTLV